MGISMTIRKAAGILVLMVAVIDMVGSAAAQGTSLNCASKLVSCRDFLNSTTKPPKECCDPLKDALTNDLQCLCDIFRSPDILKAFNIDLNQALQLPVKCGIISASSPNLCSSAAAPSPYGTITPAGNSSKGGDDNNGASRSIRTGMAGLAILLLSMWSLFA